LTEIVGVSGRIISDSRGNPTIEVEVRAAGVVGRAAAPSGASTGTYEAVALPARQALEALNGVVAPRLVGEDVKEQARLDALLWELDGSPNFSAIGGNTAVATSLACARAAAAVLGVPLYRYLGGAFTATPYPLGNVVNGGAHAPGATDIQEFLALPLGATSMADAVFVNARVHRLVKEQFASMGVPCGKGDEGGWAPQVSDDVALHAVAAAVDTAAEEIGFVVRFGLDLAASQLWRQEDGAYMYRDAARTPEEQVAYVVGLVDEYSLAFVEDPLHEDDFEGFAALTREVGDRCLVCGDDLYVTNAERINRGAQMGSTNAVLVKPNQVGTVTDTQAAITAGRHGGMVPVVSHRSGETTDDSIAHIACAFGAPIIKTGVVGGERIAKLNELIRIEEGLPSPRMAAPPL